MMDSTGSFTCHAHGVPTSPMCAACGVAGHSAGMSQGVCAVRGGEVPPGQPRASSGAGTGPKHSQRRRQSQPSSKSACASARKYIFMSVPRTIYSICLPPPCLTALEVGKREGRGSHHTHAACTRIAIGAWASDRDFQRACRCLG